MLGGLDQYQDKRDVGCPPHQRTTFFLSPLTVGDILDIEGTLTAKPKPFGDRVETAIKKGIKGWENFLWVNEEDGEITELSYGHKYLSYIPMDVRMRIANRIFSISVMPKPYEKALRATVQTFYIRGKAKGDDKETWNCDTCKRLPGLQAARRCPMLIDGKVDPAQLTATQQQMVTFPHDKARLAGGKLPKFMTHGGHEYEECPVSDVTDEAMGMYHIVMDCISRNVLPVEPPVIMAQPFLFYQARAAVEAERADIEAHEKRQKDAKTNSAKRPPPKPPGRKRQARLGKKQG